MLVVVIIVVKTGTRRPTAGSSIQSSQTQAGQGLVILLSANYGR